MKIKFPRQKVGAKTKNRKNNNAPKKMFVAYNASLDWISRPRKTLRECLESVGSLGGINEKIAIYELRLLQESEPIKIGWKHVSEPT